MECCLLNALAALSEFGEAAAGLLDPLAATRIPRSGRAREEVLGLGVLGGLGFRGLGVRGLGALGFRGLGGYIYGFG